MFICCCSRSHMRGWEFVPGSSRWRCSCRLKLVMTEQVVERNNNIAVDLGLLAQVFLIGYNSAYCWASFMCLRTEGRDVRILPNTTECSSRCVDIRQRICSCAPLWHYLLATAERTLLVQCCVSSCIERSTAEFPLNSTVIVEVVNICSRWPGAFRCYFRLRKILKVIQCL